MKLTATQKKEIARIAAKMYDKNIRAENATIWNMIDAIIHANKIFKRSRRSDELSVALHRALSDEASRRLSIQLWSATPAASMINEFLEG